MILKTKLYEYQSKAVDKLSKLKVGALYMEQGTGKTRTALEIIKNKMSKGKVEVVLWLCPCSVKNNLKEDIIKHTGELPTENNIIIRGIESLSSSDKLYLQLSELVKNYEVYLIVDESNLVKNKMAIRTERIISISSFCKYKMILNGTPISKNEADLFAQWYILDWRILGYKSFYSFAANHLEYKKVRLPSGREITTDQIIRVLNVDYLTEKIAPYMYQIKKDEVLKELKPKEYHMRYFCLDDLQEEEYGLTKELFLFNVVDWRSETIFKLFSALQHITSGKRVLSAPEKRMRTENMYTWENNPRIQCLKRTLEDIGEDKCIIFAKYQDEINDIALLLQSENKSYIEFTGKISQKKRQENREKFKNDVQFMLANKQCGAYGLNLQFCHNIIFYSNDFDLATRLQAEDRVHRIGQEKTVNIYDICCEYTIDVFIANCLQNKSNLLDSFKKQISIWKEAIEMEKIRIRQMNSIKDNDFYNILGYFFASKNFRKKLTYPLSNEDDWIWLVAFNKDNNVIGFLSLEPMVSGYKIDSIYVLNDYYKIYGNRVYNELIEKAIKLSKNNKKYISATIKKELVVVFEKYNFYVTKNKSEKWINIRRDLNENIQKQKCI